MQRRKYFKTKSGRYVTDIDIRTTLDILGGDFDEHDSFTGFLVRNGVLTPIVPLTDDVVKDIFKAGQTICAVDVYRNIHDCSLKEAYEKVKSYQKED